MQKYNVKLNQIMWGTDPEWFVADSDGKIVPAPYFAYMGLPHTDDPKHPRFYDKDGVVIHQDGVAFEATVPASRSWRTILERVHEAQDILINQVLVGHHNLFDTLAIVPSIEYDFNKWNRLGDWMVMANQFGCDQDYDAFENGAPTPQIDATTWPTRYGGGHIHMSGHPLMKENPILSIKAQALTTGLTASAYSPMPDKEAVRAGLYGKIGKFRPQHYPDDSWGVEYRTPSNSWTDVKNISLAEMIFTAAEFAITNLMNNPDKIQKLSDELESHMRQAISTCDQALSKEILRYVYAEA